MKTTITTISILLAAFMFNQATAQCNFELGYNFVKPDKTFKKSGKSKTLKLKPGQTYEMNLTLRENKTYFISVKGQKILENVQYRLKTVDETGNEDVLYDNSVNEFINHISFESDEPMNVILEIVTQPTPVFIENPDKTDIGVLIAYR